MAQLASSLQDVYNIADSLIGAGIKATGKDYPDGLFLLDGETSQKMAHSLIQINHTIPALANKITTVSAPAIFFTTLLTDLAVKGMVVYGILKTPNPGR